jgi:hypothetical protein
LRSKSFPDIDPIKLTQRACRQPKSCNETSTGAVRESCNSAHLASSYGLIVGSSSVRAIRQRMKQFMWLSGTWCTTWRTVHPPGRYGVSSCWSSSPRTASRNRAPASEILVMHWGRVEGSTGADQSNLPIGYRKSISIGSYQLRVAVRMEVWECAP